MILPCGLVINDGVGTLHDVYVYDTEDEVYKTDPDIYVPIFVAASIAPGASVPYSGTISSTINGLDNTVIVRASSAPGGEATVSDSAVATCQGASLSALISVTKGCNSYFIEDPDLARDGIIIGVNFSGQVCNDHDNLTFELTRLFDDKADMLYQDPEMLVPFALPLFLPAGTENCVSFYGSYIPHEFDTETKGFVDQVTASGVLKIDDTIRATEQAGATCYICVDECGCPPPTGQ